MNIKDIQSYAKENGIPEKRIKVLVELLHPDENGDLNAWESLEAMAGIAEVVRAREFTKILVESIKDSREQCKK